LRVGREALSPARGARLAGRVRASAGLVTSRTSRRETVTPELAGPLDRAVRGLFGVSWGRARGWIGSGKVRVGGEVVTSHTARTPAGVELVLDEQAPLAPAPGSSRGAVDRLEVVHADPHVVVVAKPAGLATIPYESRGSEGRGSSREDTLDARVRAWIERHARSRRAGGGSTDRVSTGRVNLGVVHRLDKETTGLIVFTRTWLAKQSLASQFRKHTVVRRYLAIVHGDVRAQTFASVLVADRGDGLRGSARRPHPGDRGARAAVTHVEPVQRLKGATLIACRLETGRTHQIRIHLSEAGHPIVGERVYVRGYPGPLLEAPRLMLHAAELGFVHPATGQAMRWELPLPDDMLAVLDRLSRS
jgi:23S rRNA pseudouridine1911/1915/1917 synthase